MKITQGKLRTLLRYSRSTGIFTWLKRPANPFMHKGGIKAGTPIHHGYITIKLWGKHYLAHRLAWLYVTGDWPQGEIDHINGDRSDNSWRNIRDTTRAVNGQNRKHADGDSLTGVLGVTPRGSRFRAQLVVDGKTVYLGTFDSARDAHLRYLVEKRKRHPGCTL